MSRCRSPRSSAIRSSELERLESMRTRGCRLPQRSMPNGATPAASTWAIRPRSRRCAMSIAAPATAVPRRSCHRRDHARRARRMRSTNPADRRDTVGSIPRCDAATKSRAAFDASGRAQPAMGCSGGERARGVLDRAAGAARSEPRRFPRAAGARGGQDLPDASRRGARGRGFLPLLRGAARASSSRRPRAWRDPPGSTTNCRCMAAACSPASVPGIFRWRFSRAR